MWPETSHVYKKATKPGLPTNTICTRSNGRKHKILYFMEIALSNSYQLLIWWKGGTSLNLSSFYFNNSWIYVEVMTPNVNFPIWPVQYLACQTSQRMCKVTLIENRVHMVLKKNNWIASYKWEPALGLFFQTKWNFNVIVYFCHLFFIVR